MTLLIGPGLCPARATLYEASSYPYELETTREVALFGTGAALLGLSVILHDTFTPSAEQIDALSAAPASGGIDAPARRRWSPTASRISDLGVGLGQAALVIQAGEAALDDDSAAAAAMYGETVLLTVGATQLLKVLIHRPRPFLYNPDPDIPERVRRSSDAWRSFPSGHTALAFAAALQFGLIHERLHPHSSGWGWSVGLSVATLTGCLRYVAGKHYPSDILAGAVLGSFVGWLVPTLHEVDEDGEWGGELPAPTLSFGFAF